ncbi:sensor histidine kinase [Frondihabitans cladoniiphilus]|uniref:Histidine kinase n=1 Tax=Frondihabitans cladoniiphilus TaxID=715785 RepID=A0ABP8W0G5_9MICO
MRKIDSAGDADLDRAVLEGLARRLRERSSEFASAEALEGEFVLQVRSILAEARQLVRSGSVPSSAVSVEYGDAAELANQGELRARQNQHPAEALMAAEVLFDEALPLVIGWAGASHADEVVHVVRSLHRAIWRRFPPGAIAYTEALRQRLSTAHLDSRLQVSRVLHDRASHGIAAGVQRLESIGADVLADGQTATAEQLALVAEFFRTALTEVRNIAVDLRTRVGERSLFDAVRAYLDESRDGHPPVRLTTNGREFALTSVQKEESLYVIQEALHNARRHAANATLIGIDFVWGERSVRIEVTDDGSGFDPSRIRVGALGLAVMRERSDSIGSAFVLSAAPGQGTTVGLTVPRS